MKGDEDRRRMGQAFKMIKSGQDQLADLRLRADILLRYEEEGRVDLSLPERDTLERICVAPRETDREFLGSFDPRLEAMR